MGSPPRMRGRVYPDCTDCEEGGITPAYAGKRKRKLKPKRLTGDHPRVCGEEPHSPFYNAPDQGSPPRMRGRAVQRNAYTTTARITPAYAGKSLASSSAFRAIRDHPRVCGEETKKIP